MEKQLDVVIFGATGFTGKYTVLHAVKVLSNLKWGIAGRNKQKLLNTLKEVDDKVEEDLSEIPIIIADVQDDVSLEEMAKQTKIVVNCCGPYRFFGEPVIKACIKASTHHIDVSGEPQFMERMQLEYYDLAESNGVYIVSACGFDSIPADLGTVFFEKKFNGQVNSIETFMWFKYIGSSKPESGAALHYGTWESAIYGLTHAHELRTLRSKLYKSKLPIIGPMMRERKPYVSSRIGNTDNVGYCLPFPGADRSVVMRSQRFMFENEKKTPIQLRTYFTVKSLIQVFMLFIFGGIFALMTKFVIGRKLLLQFPKFFSFGAASHEGPPESKMNNTKFILMFLGNGWSGKSSDPNELNEPNKSLLTKVTGINPGYGATCISLLLSAVTILKEKELMPGKGGVLTPGYAFAKTSLIERLCENGFTFEVVESNDSSVTEDKKDL